MQPETAPHGTPLPDNEQPDRYCQQCHKSDSVITRRLLLSILFGEPQNARNFRKPNLHGFWPMVLATDCNENYQVMRRNSRLSLRCLQHGNEVR